jgi:hypothetical protein
MKSRNKEPMSRQLKMNHALYMFPLLDCIGKISITGNTSGMLINALLDTSPHTIRVDGKYIKWVNQPY